MPESTGKPEISVTQLIAGGAATITATVVSSYFGVGGTIIGGGIMSVLSTVGAAVYKHYLDRGKEQIVDRMPTLGVRRQLVAGDDAEPKDADDPTAVFAASDTRRIPVAAGGAEALAEPFDPDHTRLDLPLPGSVETRRDLVPIPDEVTGPRRRPNWYVLGGAAAGLFLIVMGLVTAFELFTGKPLANTVQGRPGSGTSWHHTGPSPAVTPGSTTSGGSPERSTSPSTDPTREPTEAPSQSSGAPTDAPASKQPTGPTGGPTEGPTGRPSPRSSDQGAPAGG